MPAVSKAQQRLMAAAEHGATFPKAVALRKSMSGSSLKDFAEGSMKGKPEKVSAAPKPKVSKERVNPAMKMNAGRKPASNHPHGNLGKYLHPKKAQ